MKAAIFYGPGDIRLEEISLPKISDQEVLVKVKAAGICGSDLHFYGGTTESFAPAPGSILGHELSGEVVKVGDKIHDIEIGDRVGIEPLIGCGKCEFCLSGDYHLCRELKHIGIAFGGGFAEYTKAPRRNVFPLPANVSYEAAALLDCYAVSVHAIHRVPIQVVDTVAVLGSGTIGLTTMQVAKAAGARRVIVVGRRSESLKLAREAGADETINLTNADLIEEVGVLTNTRGVDITFECVGGTASTLSQAISIARPGGKVCVIGLFTATPPLDLWAALTKELDVKFAMSYARWDNQVEFAIALDLMTSERLRPEPLITHRLPLEKITEGFNILLDKARTNAVKVILQPSQST